MRSTRVVILSETADNPGQVARVSRKLTQLLAALTSSNKASYIQPQIAFRRGTAELPKRHRCHPATTMTEQTNHDTNRTQQSVEEVWYLKEIHFRPDSSAPSKRFKIVTQNFNG